MIPSEAWLLLTCGSVWQAQRIERGFGSVTPEDVKHALQGLPERPTLYGFAAFLADPVALADLSRIEHVRLVDRAIKDRWEQRRGQETLRRLVSLALYETIGGRRCPECLGRGCHLAPPSPRARALLRYRRFIEYKRTRAMAIKDPARYVAEIDRLSDLRRLANEQLAELDAMIGGTDPCASCRGTGRIDVNETLRSRLSGIPRRTWYRGWDERYATYFAEVQRLEAWAIGHVKGRLKSLAA